MEKVDFYFWKFVHNALVSSFDVGAMACPKCCPCKYGCTREQYCVSCTVHRPKKLAGDAPKVEEIARQIAEKLVAHHLSVWQGLEKAVELYIELIIPFLRPYLPPECFYCKFYGQEHCKRHFPPASQTPINTHELAHEILRHRIIILECENGVKPCGEYNGEPIYNMGEMIGAETIAINQLQDVIDAWLKRQPASTARTDGLKQLRDDGWMVAVHNDYRVNGKFHTFWLLTRVGREGQFVKGEGETDEDALAQIVRQLASHAAPGSVPQAEPPNGGDDGCGLFFCDEHLSGFRGDHRVCPRCAASKPPYKRIKPDHPEWIEFKMTDLSWAEWRESLAGAAQPGDDKPGGAK